MQKAAKTLGLEELLKRKPRNLSGGQRQRVAMGRAIVREPAVFLMDEPLSNLDAKLRVQTRGEISRLQRELATTTIYVTHDQVEAMTMGDRVAVMRKGELQQVAQPQELYDRPVNLFVGGFIGSPAMNMLEATVTGRNGSGDRSCSRQRPDARGRRRRASTRTARSPRYEGRPVVLGIRPESLEEASLARDAPADTPPHGTGRAARGARLGADGALRDPAARSSRDTEETKELARESTRRGRPRDRRARSSSAASGRARRSSEGDERRGRGRHALAALLRPDTGLGIYEQGNEKGATT